MQEQGWKEEKLSPFCTCVCRDTHTRRFRTAAPSWGGGAGDGSVRVCVCVCACTGGTGREQSNCPEKVTAGGKGRGLQLVPDALRS